jgi:DNA-binding NtrC family response regulator
MMDYAWPGNIRELENLVKRYVIVGNEAQIVRELSTHRTALAPVPAVAPVMPARSSPADESRPPAAIPITSAKGNGVDADGPSLLEIGRRAAMSAEREAIERVLNQTHWNRRQAARILKISYKALLNKLKAIEEQNAQNKNLSA